MNWKGCLVDSRYSIKPEALAEILPKYRAIGLEVVPADLHTEEEIIQSCQDMDVLLCNGNPPITRKVLEALPNVKVVQRFGVGVNSVDLDAARDTGTLVINLPGFCVEELAVHSTALILDLLRNVGYYDRGIRQGEWRKAKGFKPPEMTRLTLGLFGFGSSARLLYRIFHDGFGSRVITNDPYLTTETLEGFDVRQVSFEELLQEADVISLHVPLDKSTYHVFDYAAFCKMKPNAMIINISRGAVICEADLVRALQEGQIRYAGLDVFEKEPLPEDSPLRKMDNVALTCHSAYYGEAAEKNTNWLVVELMEQILCQHRISGRYVANLGVSPKFAPLEIV